MRHYISTDCLSADETRAVVRHASALKRHRADTPDKPLAGQTWALLFSKSSTRTRVSFEVGLHELGANSIFLSDTSSQTGRGEPVRDSARVLGRMAHGAIIRTFAQADVAEFAKFSGIPTVNALTDDEHPCQILGDLQTIEERRGPLAGQRVVFAGDAMCNVAQSWLRAARLLGFRLTLASPPAYRPPAELLRTAPTVDVADSIHEAARDADVLYTDVWVSMGKEAQHQQRIDDLRPFQINAATVALAKPDALVMHCLPAYRGCEITDDTLETHADTIFAQSENRLHAQKALLLFLNQHRQ